MIWKEAKTPKGILKYRMPNIQEGYLFLSMIDRISTAQDLWKIKSKFLSEMGSMIDYASIGYADYGSFLDDKENNADACAEIAEVVLTDVTSLVKKKT